MRQGYTTNILQCSKRGRYLHPDRRRRQQAQGAHGPLLRQGHQDRLPSRHQRRRQIDFINIHWQWTSGDTPVKTFTDHVQKAHDMFGKDIWVTEYQAPAGSADPVKFMKDATAWLDKQSYVKRYAYFSVNDKLTNGDALNDLGVAYAGM
jgi:hypothetical protein